jgi:hypothetical protein
MIGGLVTTPDPAPCTVLVIDLEPGEQLGGWMRREPGTRIRFEGLLEFVALLERLRHDEP